MTGRIIAFVDGSFYSASVCAHAGWAATRLGAGVDVLHVVGRRRATRGLGLGARSALQAELAALDAQRARLEDSRGFAILEDAEELLRAAGITDLSADLVHGDLLAELSSREAGAGLLLIGKRGEAADYATGHLGSNLERIARTATRPLLVASQAFRPVGKVLVALDGSPVGLKIADHIARSPLFAGLSLTLAHVGAGSTEIRRRLSDAQSILRAGGIEADLRVLPGEPQVTLGHLVRDEAFDMLVMGVFGHSRIRSLLIGSTTAAMIHACKVPVLLLR
ncbi:universal stress protein [Sinirhodobacter populi]|uniref:Universal stress protein n=1 Tax=Paenirhodobacter populi TaxID=2306993 RepID=A0A443K7C2_9RHOB|nr:universal stress protein [Sinirhodobacter populi]RWR28677.1 universal stress protein [Sinirhodobacter populi]